MALPIKHKMSFSKRLSQNTSGVSIMEFAFVLPVLLTMGLFGAEISWMATTKMKTSQIALSLADNASRLGQTDNSGVTPTITEGDVDAVLAGALKQGESIGMATKARVILSSLEYDPFTGRQFIHWQRCKGDVDRDSAYGNDSDKNGLTGDEIDGMGSGATKVTAAQNQAVMYVEIYYEYDALFANPFGSGDQKFKEEAAFLIRDDRNLQSASEAGITGTSAGNEC
ncbi:TadE/TadG family type IV pilus assembly protein [Altererythrobacter sp. ZODW24]|uniref:TadE/TadG family type IV pilus assembly protein n=1 Tax=Altererythrobacter sp. ZODW24 TaxID=2185142 RepID=UPI000DF7D3B9|nr:TadE/TadG family type IV pilus assembly protein [Altererythrobacter sp. ZODW24]